VGTGRLVFFCRSAQPCRFQPFTCTKKRSRHPVTQAMNAVYVAVLVRGLLRKSLLQGRTVVEHKLSRDMARTRAQQIGVEQQHGRR